MQRIEHEIVVHRPVSVVYDQWTQFEEFPRFMEGVERVEQLDDALVHWVAEIAGVRREWEAEIVHQEPDHTIAWRGFGGPENSGLVTFVPLDDKRARVRVAIEWAPGDAVETAAELFGIADRRVAGDLERFKTFIESRPAPTGAWRGTISPAVAPPDSDLYDRL